MIEEESPALKLYHEAMAALRAGNADEAERIAGQMNVRSDARLIMEKVAKARARGTADSLKDKE